MKNADGSPVTVSQANRERRCLVCGDPDALLLKHADGRLLRACIPCLNNRTYGDWSVNCSCREPLESELHYS